MTGLLDRWRRWRAYRARLAAAGDAEIDAGYKVTAAKYEQMKQDARGQ